MGDYRVMTGGGSPTPSIYVDRVLSSNADYQNGSGPPSNTELVPGNRLAFSPDGKYLVAGDPHFSAGGGNYGRVQVYKRAGTSGSFSLLTTFVSTEATYNAFGAYVDIDADYYVVVGARDTTSKWAVFAPTGTDTWDAGSFIAVQSGGEPRFARISKASGTQTILIGNAPDAELWHFGGVSWTLTQTISAPAHTGAGHLRSGAFRHGNNQRWLALLNDCGGNGLWVETYSTPDFITWSLVQSIQIGATDDSSSGPNIGGTYVALEMSGDGRIIVAGTDAVYRSGTSIGGVYVLKATGNAGGPGSDTGLNAHSVAGLITASGSNNNSSFGHSLALSADGQFLVIGSETNNNGGTSRGVAWGINRLETLSGEVAVNAMSSFSLTSPHATTNNYRFGAGVAMQYNGAVIAVAGVDFADAGISMVRIFDQTLNDHASGVTNDNFATPIIIPDTTVSNVTLATVNLIAACNEPDEPVLGNRSLWYKLQPASGRTLSIDTLQSTTAVDPFYPTTPYVDTIIQIYDGSAIGSLSTVTGGDNDDGGTPSAPDEFLSAVVGCSLTGGHTYYIQIGSWANSDAPMLKVRYSLS